MIGKHSFGLSGSLKEGEAAEEVEEEGEQGSTNGCESMKIEDGLRDGFRTQQDAMKSRKSLDHFSLSVTVGDASLFAIYLTINSK